MIRINQFPYIFAALVMFGPLVGWEVHYYVIDPNVYSDSLLGLYVCIAWSGTFTCCVGYVIDLIKRQKEEDERAR